MENGCIGGQWGEHSIKCIKTNDPPGVKFINRTYTEPQNGGKENEYQGTNREKQSF